MPDGGFQRDVTELRLRLLANGYEPLPITGPNEPVRSAGKRPRLGDWASCAITPDEIRRWGQELSSDTNTGLRCGCLLGVDIDVPDGELAQAVEDLAIAMLGRTALRRVGRAPKLLLAYRAADALPKAETPEFLLPDGTKVQVEVLGKGQQFVSHGVHPDTGQRYAWTAQAPEHMPLSELPIVQPARLRAFVAAATSLFRDAGGRTAREVDATSTAPQPLRLAASHTAHGSGGFFHEVNRCALEHPDRWVKQVFPAAYWQPNATSPPGAWRVRSSDIGRPLEEDISIHPREGIQDFGTRESLSAIDLVIRHESASDAVAAAMWLCDQLRIDPVSLGWRGQRTADTRPAQAGAVEAGQTREAAPQQPGDALWRDLGAWDPQGIPQRPWVVPGYLMRGAVTALSGQGAGGKSSLVVAWTISLATGDGLGPFEPLKPAIVVNYNTEDDREEQQRRYSAALISAGKAVSEVMPRIVRCGPNNVGTLFERNPDTGRIGETGALRELERICLEARADVLVCDPLAELHNAEENDNTAMRAVIAAFRSLAKRLNIAVLILHHDRKGSGAPGDMDRIRGASAISGALRVILTLTTMSPEEADKLGVPPDERRRHFRLDGAKSNYAPTTEAEWWRLSPYEIGNGDQVAAVHPWTPPTAFSDLSADDCVTILHQLNRGTRAGHAYASTRQAGQDWAGRLLVDGHGKTAGQAEAIIATWVRSGILVAGMHEGPRRGHPRKAFTVNMAAVAEIRGRLRQGSEEG
jgi:hypothetical protein